MNILRAAAFLVLLSLAAAPAQQNGSTPAARSMERKLDHLDRNARAATPDPTPTVLTEEEVNAYVQSGGINLPRGVQRVHLVGQPGAVTADMQVDFDQITQGSRSINPLLALFSGVHQVQVATHAHGEHGVGHVHVDSVFIDGVEVPPMALQFFADRYVKPKHPELGIDSRIQMPDRIDSAVVGRQRVTLVQK